MGAYEDQQAKQATFRRLREMMEQANLFERPQFMRDCGTLELCADGIYRPKKETA